LSPDRLGGRTWRQRIDPGIPVSPRVDRPHQIGERASVAGADGRMNAVLLLTDDPQISRCPSQVDKKLVTLLPQPRDLALQMLRAMRGDKLRQRRNTSVKLICAVSLHAGHEDAQLANGCRVGLENSNRLCELAFRRHRRSGDMVDVNAFRNLGGPVERVQLWNSWRQAPPEFALVAARD
jgi:hypothetical protein